MAQQVETDEHIRATQRPKSCPVDGCDEQRFSSLGMDYHLLRDHDY